MKEKLSVNVKPLAMISLDFFMEEYENIKTGKNDLVSILNLYYKMKDENKKTFIQEKNPASLQNMYEGFEVTVRQKMISYCEI
jgi:hypothetical protein